ncbi:MAG: preprotein translocase subunit SecE [Clostridia bacterium]|nr:preprotein translocase subunit SecE [Clostridia bacterium]
MDNNKSFIKETKTELKKVIWPTRQEVINGTATVIVMVAIVGIIIFAFDFASGWAIGKIIKSDIGVTDTDTPDEYTQDIDLSDLVNVESEGTEATDTTEGTTTETTQAQETSES